MKKRSIVLLLCIGVLLVLSGGPTWDRADHGGLRLESPSFVALAAQAQEKGVNFLQQEAGIAAYVKVDQAAIDLAKVKGALKTVETDSNEYVIGEIALPDLPEKMHPHVYVNKDGWIVAYYTKNEPASKIMHWKGTRTTLEDAIRKIYDALPLPYPTDVKYYNFKYPGANRIMLITEVIDSDEREGGYHKGSLYLTIPKNLHPRLFEASWSLYSSSRESELLLDDARIDYLGGEGISYGDLTNRLKPEVRYKISVRWYVGQGVAIVLIYQV